MKRILIFFMLIFSSVYTMPIKGDRVTIRSPIDGNLISASERLTVNAQVEGSVISASKFLDINNNSRNVVAAASEINIGGDIQSILVSASKNLTVNGRVGEAVVAAADSILFNGTTKDIVVAAREVDITGEVDNLFAAADRIYISGTVRGDLYSTTSRVELRGDGRILGRIYSPEEIPHKVRGEMVKRSWGILRMASLLHSLLGILFISFLLRRSSSITNGLSESLFKKGLLAFFTGIFFMVVLPVFSVITLPLLGIYSLGIMMASFFIFIVSKSFLVVALSDRYNYFLSLIVVVGLSFFTLISLILSIVGFGIFLLYIKDTLANTPQEEA